MSGGLFSIELVLVAFAGGAFGAAIGALPSFSLAGLLVVVGELYGLIQRVGDAALPAIDITGSVAFGPVLGPHVAFGGGAAAAAYAARRGYFETDFDYHPAKNVTQGLGSRPDVLFVGGAFGVVGHLIATGADGFAVPTDPAALGVVCSALLHRVVFGYSLIGASIRDLFDMTPYARAQAASGSGSVSGDGDTVTDGGAASARGYAVEPWLPYQYRWGNVLALGLAVGVLGAYVAYITASAFLAFGISVVPLLLINADVAKIPVTHHVTLPASTAVLASVDAPLAATTPATVAGSLPMSEALLLGAVFGGLGALLGEVAQRVFYAHADTHLDPPAASIVVTSVLIALLAVIGFFPTAAWIPLG
jgi:hypothetical protein